MDTELELWDRLDGESSRAYEAFRTYVSLPIGNRTMVTAYRRFVDNRFASKVSDSWNEWARRYAWKERARRYDAHMDRIRRNAMEKAVQEEAAEQARQAERIRNNLNELMAVGHEKVMEYLEELDPATMRFSDVVQAIRLHMDAIEKLGLSEEGKPEDDWTEEDDAEAERIAKEIRARRASEDRAQGPDEEALESDDSDEGSSEDSEDNVT